MGATEAIYVAIVVVPSFFGTVIAIRYWIGNNVMTASDPAWEDPERKAKVNDEL